MAHASSELTAETLATLPADVALHARPAGLFVREAARFSASVTVSANGKTANAKSILEVLALGATGGTAVAIAASGDDAVEAAEDLAAFLARIA
ncbi:MAG: phosphocarrier protein HPr [Gaiellaceae bacterium]|nr:phosphocarrier protein HPr [Gaiellaceae bacterium]